MLAVPTSTTSMRKQWDAELLELFDVPRASLPTVMDCAAEFGTCDATLFDAALPIYAVWQAINKPRLSGRAVSLLGR